MIRVERVLGRLRAVRREIETSREAVGAEPLTVDVVLVVGAQLEQVLAGRPAQVVLVAPAEVDRVNRKARVPRDVRHLVLTGWDTGERQLRVQLQRVQCRVAEERTQAAQAVRRTLKFRDGIRYRV